VHSMLKGELTNFAGITMKRYIFTLLFSLASHAMYLPSAETLAEKFDSLKQAYTITSDFPFYGKLIQLSTKNREVSDQEIFYPILDYARTQVTSYACVCCTPILNLCYPREVDDIFLHPSNTHNTSYVKDLFAILYANETEERQLAAIQNFQNQFKEAIDRLVALREKFFEFGRCSIL